MRTLKRLDYRVTRQRGSHINLVTERNGKHHIVVPDHRPLKTGTLNALVKSVADHHGMTRDEVINLLRS